MSTKQQELREDSIPIPDKIKVNLEKKFLRVEGPVGKARKSFKKIPVSLTLNEKNVIIKSEGGRKRDYAILNTAKSLITTLFEGVLNGYTVKLKTVHAHFPITVRVKETGIFLKLFRAFPTGPSTLRNFFSKLTLILSGIGIEYSRNSCCLVDISQ